MSEYILVVNPGSTSTKLAVYDGEHLVKEDKVVYTPQDLASFPRVFDQLPVRLEAVRRFWSGTGLGKPVAVVGRGGMLRPIEGGVYEVNERMITDLKNRVGGEHASNLGAPIASAIANEYGVPAYVVDPVAVDEFEPLARISGLPEIPRRSQLHALNIRAVARRAAAGVGKSLADLNLIVCHLGGGISVCAMRGGRMIDVNNATQGGPFSPERAGSLPAGQLVGLAYSGQYGEDELARLVVGRGGVSAYLGTNNMQEVHARAASGVVKADEVRRAMVYQIAKEVGAMSAVLYGNVDEVVLTGGLAHSAWLTDEIKSYVGYIAPVIVIPGEDEAEALALGSLRVLRGLEKAKEY